MCSPRHAVGSKVVSATAKAAGIAARFVVPSQQMHAPSHAVGSKVVSATAKAAEIAARFGVPVTPAPTAAALAQTPAVPAPSVSLPVVSM
eukprot:1147024-Pelagomonas_calceolata.AAC.1